MAQIIEKLLNTITNAHVKSGAQIKKALPHRVIVIDEVDCFQAYEKAFNLLVSHILKGKDGKS